MSTEYPSGARTTETHGAAPIVVDLGKRGRRAIKRLREGEGKLYAEVNDVLDGLRREGAVKADAQLVVVVVRQRRSRSEFQFDWPSRC
ncbi:MAG TPA: hypothetical protein VFK57_18990 [Vicinamibacterales bacterium]|nr:hypothetical protein [Vicinamibacterales bacterium]